jgi:hypothetical protein
MTTVYSGTLDFSDKDCLTVSRLIVREDAIAVDAEATWSRSGVWTVSATALREGNRYESPIVVTKVKAKGPTATSTCRLAFWDVRLDEDGLTLSGCWHENHTSYRFSGTLTKKPSEPKRGRSSVAVANGRPPR